MKGFWEILFSCLIGLASILILAQMRKLSSKEDRTQPHEDPIASTGDIIDPSLALNWGLQQIHAPAARKRHRGTRDVVVAVIDTGCDVHHPDLSTNIWNNPGESGLDDNGNPKGSNGIDDDGNGFIDDIHGWNFTANSSDVSDEHGHGTHIAGIIGPGVAPNVKLMILKYFDTEADGAANLKHTIAAIRYAVKNGADIINYSGGGIMRSSAEEEVLRWAAHQGVLVVAAAGNEGVNSDFFHFYPADYGLPNIVSVAAIDSHEHLLNMSNYGITTVDLAAPGKNIFSTLPNGSHGYMSGTSQATAFVTGVAALLLAANPRLHDPQVLIQHLLHYSSPRVALKGKTRSSGLLDAKLALDGADLVDRRSGVAGL